MLPDNAKGTRDYHSHPEALIPLDLAFAESMDRPEFSVLDSC
jgi:hypothetical protein